MWLWVAIGVVVIYVIMSYWFSLRVENAFSKFIQERMQVTVNSEICWEIILISFFWPFLWGRLDNKEFLKKNIK